MQDIEVYFNELERHLDCPRRIRKPFLDKTRQMANDFLQGKPDATQQEMIAYLGEPRELAQGFLESLDEEIIEPYKSRKKLLLRGWIAILAIALIVVSIWGIHLCLTPKKVEMNETLTIYPEVSTP